MTRSTFDDRRNALMPVLVATGARVIDREPKAPKVWAKDDAIYLCDNGAASCGLHLGASARYTGRDISGQRIHRVTAADVQYARDEMDGHIIRCEACGRVAT